MGERLNLAVESFEEMGHEVCLLDVKDDISAPVNGRECDQCSMGDIRGMKVVFSRKRPVK